MGQVHNRKNLAKAVIVDARAIPFIGESMTDIGIEIIGTCRHPYLYDAVAYHPDMVICPIGYKKMVIEPIMYDYYKEKLAPYNVKLLRGQRELSRNYPQNIAYNIATMGNKAFLYRRYADDIILKELKKTSAKLINVKQGYTKCSIAVVDNNSIITSDRGIYAGARREGVDALLIRPGHIKLEGFEYGFIGGCCGKIGDSLIAFAGDPAIHSDWMIMSKFLKKRGITVLPLFKGPLMDIGTIIPIIEIN